MVQIWYEVNSDVKWIMVNVGPPRSRYQDRTDEQEIYGRKMSEKDKGEGAGVGRERACPPQWGSDSCDGRAGRKTEMVDCGSGKSHCRDRPFQEPSVGQKQPAPPTLSRRLGAAREHMPSASPHSSGCQGHGRLRLSLQGNLSGTFPWLPWLPHPTWPKPHRRSTNDCRLRNAYVRVKSCCQTDLTLSPTLMSLSFLMYTMQVIIGSLSWKWSDD